MDLLLLVTLLIWLPLIPLRLFLQGGVSLWRRWGDLTYWGLFIYWAGVDIFLVRYRGPLLTGARFDSPLPVIFLGVVLCLAAIVFGTWTVQTLGLITLSTRPQITPAKAQATLIADGPYRLLRHPFYFTEWVLLLGLSLITASWLVVFLLAFAILIDPLVTLFEEKELVERFGQSYLDYRKEVPRLIPKWPTT